MVDHFADVHRVISGLIGRFVGFSLIFSGQSDIGMSGFVCRNAMGDVSGAVFSSILGEFCSLISGNVLVLHQSSIARFILS